MRIIQRSLYALTLLLSTFGTGGASLVQAADPSPAEVLAQIGAPAAWASGTGRGVVVAVIDSGVALQHPELNQRALVNGIEARGVAGVDDDDNGFTDDVLGWDFIDNDGSPVVMEGDRSSGDGIDNDHDGGIDNGVSHGTYAAGLIAGVTIGVAPDAFILPIRVLDDEGRGDHALVAQGIDYAWKRGAQVIYIGVGFPTSDPMVQAAVTRATGAGAVIVAPAGNSTELLFPAAHPRVLSVGIYDGMAPPPPFGGRGATVSINAPGTRLIASRITPVTGDLGYARVTGTSYSAALTAGAIAVLLSAVPTLTSAELIQYITRTADLFQGGNDSGALNLARAVELARLLD